MAKMQVDYNLKTSGERFQNLCLYDTKIIENLLWFFSPCKSLLDIFLLVFQEHLWVKACNLNFSEVLTKREETPRDTAALTR